MISPSIGQHNLFLKLPICLVCCSCESALVNVLKMRGDDQQFAQQCLEKLDSGAKASLQETMAKVLQRVAKQPEGKEEEIDNTFLK